MAFDFAPGEQNPTSESFSPNIILFWLKTEIAASSTRIRYKAPNTLLGVIPLGSNSKTIPLNNVASVDTDTRFNLGPALLGVILLIAGLSAFSDNAMVGVILLLIAVANLANAMNARLTFVNQAGGSNDLTVSIFEKAKLESFAEKVQELVFADRAQTRHEETMDMARQSFAAQTVQTELTRQMLANQSGVRQPVPPVDPTTIPQQPEPPVQPAPGVTPNVG
ncbi:hypothetical protein [Bifidobacterium sp. SO1]|uniref:hypothetical protein n=1 Tax=Bifidobacterium sp. SO1 TaxID=2809029 RepID=UPI001F0ADD66|nr:hypothetical protein [Bifidobacterium sp. SO1]